MDQYIKKVITYFELFSYPPSLTELHLFLGKTISIQDLENEVRKLGKKRILYRNGSKIAFQRNIFKSYEERRKPSAQYFRKVIKVLSWTIHLPFIQYVGVSGSLSMLNMTEKGDIDVFIITTTESIWTTRFTLLVYKYILKVFNPDIGNKLCFNLFFSEDGLEIHKKKQNEYIGHEILQLKPIINKNNIYEKFLMKNMWIFKFFPNVQINLRQGQQGSELVEQPFYLIFIEAILQKPQIWWLAMKNMHWDYRRGQLWLIQEDFQNKISI